MRRILTILIILILVGAGVWYFYVRPREQQGMSVVPTALKSFFPTNAVNNNGKVHTISTPTAAASAAATSPFKELSAGPVAGYTIFSQSVSTPVVPTTQTASVTPPVVSATSKKTKTSSAKAAAVAM